MATEIKPLVFEDGVDIEIRFPGSSTVTVATAIDFHEGGVMYEHFDTNFNQTRRVFRPWATISSITQAGG